MARLGSIYRYIMAGQNLPVSRGLGFRKCGCTGFVGPDTAIFSGVFRILKMGVHRVCGTGPQNIFWCV
jgi:hypothetical protein